MGKGPIYVAGIDLGGLKRKTTGICLLGAKDSRWKAGEVWTVESQQILLTLKPYLPYIKVIAVDGPLTKGVGKGDFRLYEKFLSQKVFRHYHLQPLPPALMPQIGQVGRGLVEKLKNHGFILDKNLIEVFPTLVGTVVKRLPRGEFADGHQESAFICGLVAFWHFKKQTFSLGYKDGKLFLPALSLWKKVWQRRFLRAWERRHRLKYRLLRMEVYRNLACNFIERSQHQVAG